ncbi:hypothetical protein AX17_003220 [Amanita inopinata Kibby_2008]|nr:hypothetical protein AX17_003220 [Amanita inopinata Kibby_2008]
MGTRQFYIVPPEPEPFEPPTTTVYLEHELFGEHKMKKKMVNLKKEFGDRGLQVVVKLESIQLTPENPEYRGDNVWQVDGRLNDHICAKALYCFDIENITSGGVSFCHQVNLEVFEELSYQDGDHKWFTELFGCKNGEPATQSPGALLAKEGRLMTYPNLVEHKTESFKLADPTKKGHLKLLTLYLADPKIRIISTANIPCQRQDWWREAFEEDKTKLTKFTPEMQDVMYREVDFPISLKDAKGIRESMQKEWDSFIVKHNEMNFEWDKFGLT